MKKTLFTAAALILAAACTRELPESPKNNENLVKFTIGNASGPVMNDADKASGSKTVLANTDGSVVNWTEGDNAILFDNSGSCPGHLFTGSVLSDKTLINLSGELDEGSTAYWLLYPYNSGANMSEGVITTTLSASQTAVAGSFADKTAISLASGTRTPGQTVASGLSFQNLCPLIAFDMPSYVDGAQSVTLTPNSGCAIAGTISFNASTGAMTAVSGANSITLNGPIAAGERYFIAVAPKTYENGFTLTVTTAGNQTYSASTTKTIDATPGKVYYLGTLGLKLDVTPTVTFNHTYSGNVLTGTTATLNIPVASELAAMIDHWTVTLTNKDSGDIVRNYTTNSGTGSPANEYAYLPMGKYTLAASYTTLDGRSKSLPTIEVTNDKEPVFSVNVTGKTSYDYYKSNGASSANSKDGSTIYELGTSVTISTDLLNNTNYNKTYTYSYDGGTAVSISGNSVSIANKTGQSWKTHTLEATCTFDGVEKKDSRDLHVTGLPWAETPPGSSNWEYTGADTNIARFESSYLQIGDKDGGFESGVAKVTFRKKFVVPENITVNVTANYSLYTYYLLGVYYYSSFVFKINDTKVFNEKSEKVKKEERTYTKTKSATLPDKATIEMINQEGNAIYRYCLVRSIKIEYK